MQSTLKRLFFLVVSKGILYYRSTFAFSLSYQFFNFFSLFTVTLAVCNEAHAINIYELPDLATSIPEKVTLCERPLKILFSIAPVDALRFIKPNCIALASSSNRTLTLWRI